MKSAIVTGANGQLGSVYVKTLLDMGFRVYAVDLNSSNIVRNEQVKYINLDITKEKDVHDFFNSIKEIDVLINNAGIGVFTNFEERTAEEFENVMRVNLLGTFLMSQQAIKLMKTYGNGKIINIGSIYGLVSSDERIYGNSGRNNSEVYSATKAGVIHMTRYLAAHYAKYNIQINSISPGGIYNEQSEDFVQNYIYKTPANRMGTPQDLQSAVRFLIAEESNYVNGINITVDGGFSVW